MQDLMIRETLPLLELLRRLNVAPFEADTLYQRVESGTYDYSNCPCCQDDTEDEDEYDRPGSY